MLWMVQLAHAAYVAFVLTAPALLLYAGLARPAWLRPLRAAHVLALAFIAAQYALDWPCPLTQLENRLAGRPPGTELLAGLAGHGALVAGVVVAYLIASAAAHAVAWRPPETA